MNNAVISLFIVTLIIPIVPASSISEYDITFEMQKDTVLTSVVIAFETEVPYYVFRAPPGSKMHEVRLDNELLEPEQEMHLSGGKMFQIIYDTDFYLDNDDFLFDFSAPENITHLSISLKLPPGMYLEKSLDEGGSIYPKPDIAITNGESLIFQWERNDRMKHDEMAIFAKLQSKSSNGFMMVLWGATILLLLLIAIFVLKRRKTKYYLKEDEETIVDVIRRRENQCIEQGTLRVITGFPKSTLSRLLQELEERKIIYKEKKGKKNLVYLK